MMTIGAKRPKGSKIFAIEERILLFVQFLSDTGLIEYLSTSAYGSQMRPSVLLSCDSPKLTIEFSFGFKLATTSELLDENFLNSNPPERSISVTRFLMCITSSTELPIYRLYKGHRRKNLWQ